MEYMSLKKIISFTFIYGLLRLGSSASFLTLCPVSVNTLVKITRLIHVFIQRSIIYFSFLEVDIVTDHPYG